jgi:hypothetical protein
VALPNQRGGLTVGLFLTCWGAVFLFGDDLPGISAATHFLNDLMGGDCPVTQCMDTGPDPLTVTVIAAVVTAALKVAFKLLVAAGKAGQGVTNGDEEE